VNAGIYANVFAVAGHRVSSHRVSCVKAALHFSHVHEVQPVLREQSEDFVSFSKHPNRTTVLENMKPFHVTVQPFCRKSDWD
jgi:hypothetical protein